VTKIKLNLTRKMLARFLKSPKIEIRANAKSEVCLCDQNQYDRLVPFTVANFL
jgi:hypothetical protein